MSESSGALKQKAPYLPFSVEEIACVKTLDDWTNCKAKVVGRLEFDPGTGVGQLTAAGEGIKATIVVSLRGVVEVEGVEGWPRGSPELNCLPPEFPQDRDNSFLVQDNSIKLLSRSISLPSISNL